jgi:flagellar protein FliS
MTNKNTYAVNQYSQVGTQAGLTDANPHRVTQMLLEGALTRIAEAQGAIERNVITEKSVPISKAISIVSALQESLDKEAGGEIAENLENLYLYIKELLVRAHSDNDSTALKESAQLLQTIKESWDAIPDEFREPAAAL